MQLVLNRVLPEEKWPQILDDGVLLCELITCIATDLPRPHIFTHEPSTYFKKVENMFASEVLCFTPNCREFFLRSCAHVGVNQGSLFDPIDLCEKKSLTKVFNCIHALR